MSQEQRTTLQLIVCMGLSWLGFVTHNFADLPGQTLLSTETPAANSDLRTAGRGMVQPGSGVAAVGLGLHATPGRRHPERAAYTAVALRSGATLYHYGFHVLYTVTQLPLIIFLIRYLRKEGGA